MILLRYIGAIVISLIWFSISLYIAIPWIEETISVLGAPLALFIIFGIALLQGLTMAFVYGTLVTNPIRPPKYLKEHEYPPISVLVAAYNEESTILQTLDSINGASYPAPVEIIVCNDGSKDRTEQVVGIFKPRDGVSVHVSSTAQNYGKAVALTTGLFKASHDVIVSVDADTDLDFRALKTIVSTLMLNKDRGVVAVAGNVQVKNPRVNWVTKLQNWDYIIGISVVKQAQSAYDGTLVAQGAFSVYLKSALNEGWEDTVGEDIVLSWKLLDQGHKILYEPFAVCFTNVPESYAQFFKQRRRWSRGLVEAFYHSWRLLFKNKRMTPFVWYNLFFPYLDFSYIAFLIPSILVAILFQFYLLAGIMTLFLVPLALLLTTLVFRRQHRLFSILNLKVRYTIPFLIPFIMAFQAFLVPATLSGYVGEVFRTKKTWGTK